MPILSNSPDDISMGSLSSETIPRLLVVRGNWQSGLEHSAVARSYCELLEPLFDRVIAVELGDSGQRCERFPFPLLSETAARGLAARAGFALVLSTTTPDNYAPYPGAANVGLTFWETDRFPLREKQRSPWTTSASQMDAIWIPNDETRQAFEAAAVTAPLRVIPMPVRLPKVDPEGLLDGEVYDLDRRPPFAVPQLRLARLRINRYRLSRWLLHETGPRLAGLLRDRLRSSPWHILALRQPLVVCVAEDLPHNGLRLLLAEWMEYRRRARDAAWTLVIGTASSNSADANFELILRFWEHVQAFKRQLSVRRAGVSLWVDSPKSRAFDRLIGKADACISASLGAGPGRAALTALALGKPTVVSRHAALAESLPRDYPYTFATSPTTLRFVGEPRGPDHFDPTSTWHMPVPFALAEALARLTNDSPARRAETAEAAGEVVRLKHNPERVAGFLAEEVRRLETGLYERFGDEQGRDLVRPRRPVAGRPPVRRESFAT